MAGAWEHDWRQFARDRLRAIGCNSMLEYARRDETLPYNLLAQQLGGDRLAPVQIEGLLAEEADEADEISYFVRSSLVRNLHQHVPDGFRRHGDWPLILAMASWAGMMGGETQRRCSRIARELKNRKDLPDDWLPKSIQDPVLEEVFCKEGL